MRSELFRFTTSEKTSKRFPLEVKNCLYFIFAIFHVSENVRLLFSPILHPFHILHPSYSASLFSASLLFCIPLLCIPPILHLFYPASLLSCIPPILHLFYLASLLSCISSILHPSYPASHVSCIPPILYPSYPAFVMSIFKENENFT